MRDFVLPLRHCFLTKELLLGSGSLSLLLRTLRPTSAAAGTPARRGGASPSRAPPERDPIL